MKTKLGAKLAGSKNTIPHLIIEARAGSGKTTTLIEGLKIVKGGTSKLTPSPQQQAVWDSMKLSKDARTIAMVAFNKSIATELQNRVPAGVDAMTMHSMGFKAVQQVFGRVKLEGWRVSNIIGELQGMDPKDAFKKNPILVLAVKELVGLCKMNLIDGQSEEELLKLAAHYAVDTNGSSAEIFDLVPRVLERCKDVKKDNQIDFDDMIWLPVVLGLSVTRYDLLLVDESQDLNRCQQALAKKAGTRLILCGDPKQAIYGFAGADAQSMARMAEELGETASGCAVLPLTVTRRCGKAIVAEANKLVPDFHAHESNGEGKISRMVMAAKGQTDANDYRQSVLDGDMVLCRCNAPLISECFRFLRAGRKANIQGRDVGQGLISTIKKLKADNVADLIGKIGDWLAKESEKENAKRNPSEQRLIALGDRHDCLMMFCEDVNTVQQVIDRIEAVFTDDKNKPGIKLSSIHRSKGLESKRVFFLQPEGAQCPHPMAKSAWAKEQESNLWYVCVTRAIEELIHVR